MRQTVKCGEEEWEVLPFLDIERDSLCTTVIVSIEEGAELWWIVAGVMCSITLHIDPATSASSATTYTRHIFMERRLFDDALKELSLGYPGFELDFLVPDGVIAPFGAWEHPVYRAFRWEMDEPEVQGEDDVFDSTVISASLELFSGGYGSGGGGGGLMAVTLKLRVEILYDDGTEGSILLQSVPVEVPDPFEFIYHTDGSGELLGSSFTLRCGDSAASLAGPSAYFFGDAPADVELVPALWFEYRRADGSDPIYDSATGTVLRDPDTESE